MYKSVAKLPCGEVTGNRFDYGNQAGALESGQLDTARVPFRVRNLRKMRNFGQILLTYNQKLIL